MSDFSEPIDPRDADADRLSARLDDLFSPVRSAAGLEDRVIAALRAAPAAKLRYVWTGPKKLVAAAAGLLLVGLVGALVSDMRLNAPGGDRLFTTVATAIPSPSASPPEMKYQGELADDASGSGQAFRMSKSAKLAVREAEASRRALEGPRAAAGGFGPSRRDETATGQDVRAGGPGFNPDLDRTTQAPPPVADALPSLPFDPAAKPAEGYFRPGEQAAGGLGGKFTSSAPDANPVGWGEQKGQGQPKAPAPNAEDEQAQGKGEPKPDPKAPPKDPSAAPEPQPKPEAAKRIVIRSGDMEFEVESFDSALATITKLATGIKGAFVGTVNSDKLPNGKVRGSVVVRCPPEALDGLVLDLRRELGKGGELKGVKLASADITKQYTDLESRLKAARTMETRLLQIIKEGKGEIKQLLEAERELGVWRTKIEETEGELRYYANLAALSTLTITLAEKEARAAAAVSESERVQAGVEVDDVDKAYQAVLAAIIEAKGRVLKSEVKQLSAGQYTASLQFEVAPESSGPLRDRLRQLGRVARLEIDRLTQADGGAVIPKDAKVKRGDTLFLLQLYNLANVAPRETAVVQVAVPDVPAAYQAIRDAVAKTTGRVVTATLNEQDKQNVTAQVDFEVRRADEPALRAALDAAGEVISRQVGRAPESDSVTDTKVLYRTTLFAAGRLRPRETYGMTVEVPDVEATATVFGAAVAEVKGRPVDARTNRDAAGKVTARLSYEVPLAAAAGLVERFKGAGTVRSYSAARDPQAPDGKYATARVDVTVESADRIVGADEGVWPPVRKGLSYSLSVLLTSLTWVVFGLCVVLPWALVGFAGYRVVRWAGKPATPATPPPAATPPVTP